jgi:hypothetical protein
MQVKDDCVHCIRGKLRFEFTLEQWVLVFAGVLKSCRCKSMTSANSVLTIKFVGLQEGRRTIGF